MKIKTLKKKIFKNIDNYVMKLEKLLFKNRGKKGIKFFISNVN